MCAVQAFLPQAKILADCARRRVSERNRRLRRHLARRWAIHLPRAFESPEGGGGLWPPEPRKGSRHRLGPRTAGRRVCAVQAFLPQAKILADCVRRRVSERNRRLRRHLARRWRNSLHSRWRLCRLTDVAYPLRVFPPSILITGGRSGPAARGVHKKGHPEDVPRSQNQPRTQRSGSRLEAKKKHVRRMKRP